MSENTIWNTRRRTSCEWTSRIALLGASATLCVEEHPGYFSWMAHCNERNGQRNSVRGQSSSFEDASRRAEVGGRFLAAAQLICDGESVETASRVLAKLPHLQIDQTNHHPPAADCRCAGFTATGRSTAGWIPRATHHPNCSHYDPDVDGPVQRHTDDYFMSMRRNLDDLHQRDMEKLRAELTGDEAQ